MSPARLQFGAVKVSLFVFCLSLQLPWLTRAEEPGELIADFGYFGEGSL